MPCYNSYKYDTLTGAISLSADAAANKIAVILLSASYTPDIDAHTRYGNISAHEVNIADPGRIVGYVAGGQILSAGAFAVDNTNDRGTWDNTADTTWATSTIGARYAVIVKIRNGGLNKELDNLISYFDFGSTQSSSSGNFTLQYNANGILAIT
jgi:hypothetical protein